MASTGPELDAELDQIAKDLEPISAGARGSGVMPRQRERDLREHLTRAQVHIRRATRAAQAEAAGTMRSSASGTPGSPSGAPRGGRISAARADQLSKLEGEADRLREALDSARADQLSEPESEAGRLRQELDSLAPVQATINGEPTAPDRPTTATRRPLARIAGATALVVVAAVAGLLLGRSTGENGTSSQPAIGPASSQPVDYERAVGGQLQELAGARALALERLRHARSPTAQAAAGRDLAAAHRRAAVAIAATATPASLKAVRRRLVDGLTRLAHGYRKLARGAANQDAGGYEEGRRAVERAEGDLGHGLNRIQEVPG